MIRIRKLDRYVALTFFGPFLLCLVGFAGLFIVVDFFSNIDDFSGHSSAFEIIRRAVVYYTLRLPSLLARAMPILTVVPAVICVVQLLRSNEICAMRSCGISGRRIVAPVIVCSVIVAVLAAVNQEMIVPVIHGRLVVAERMARDSDDLSIQQALVDDGQGSLFLIGQYDPETPLPTLTKIKGLLDDPVGTTHRLKPPRAFAPKIKPGEDWPPPEVWYAENAEKFDGAFDVSGHRDWSDPEPVPLKNSKLPALIAQYRQASNRAQIPLNVKADKADYYYEFGGYTESDETWMVARDIVISRADKPDIRVDMMVWAGKRWLVFGAWTLETRNQLGAEPRQAMPDGGRLASRITPEAIAAAGEFKRGSNTRPLRELIAVSHRFAEHSTFRQRCWVMIWNRVLFPLANIVLVMLAVPLVMRRDSHAALVGITLAVVVTFAFMATNFISIDLAYHQRLMWKSPLFAGTFPTILFAAIGVWVFVRMDKV